MGRAVAVVVFAAVALGACAPRFQSEDERARQDSVDRAATAIEHATESLKDTSREYARAHAEYYRNLDIAWYDRTAEALQSAGFKRFDDIEDVKHNQERPNTRSFIRVLLSLDGSTMASLFHYVDTSPAARYASLNDVRVACLETEFSDGSFVATTNGPPEADFEYGPMIETRFVRTADVLRLRRAHDAHVREYRRVFAKLRPISLWTMDDILASQARLQKIKGEYRQGMGIPATEDELNNASQHRFREAARVVSEELRSRFPSGW